MPRLAPPATPRVFARPLLALALVAALGAPQLAQSQSAYTVTKLSGWYNASDLPGTGGVRVELDASNRVHAHRSQFYLSGALIGGYLGLGNAYSYQARPAIWAASTATSASPSNLAGTNVRMSVMNVSENGQWQLIYDNSNGAIFRAVNAGRSTALPPIQNEAQYWADINNNGVAGGTIRDASSGNFVPVSWQAGALTRLPLGGFSTGWVSGVTNDNVVWGTVSNPTGDTVLARWANGQLSTQVAPTLAGRTLTGVAFVNEAGHQVLSYYAPPEAFLPPLFALWRNGQLTPLPADLNGITDFNNNDVVLGTRYIAPDQSAQVIWKDGQTTELRALITSKGGKLPTGAVVVEGLAINDQGSILARYFLPNAGNTWFRATAKP
jgi:hypothetical protein